LPPLLFHNHPFPYQSFSITPQFHNTSLTQTCSYAIQLPQYFPSLELHSLDFVIDYDLRSCFSSRASRSDFLSTIPRYKSSIFHDSLFETHPFSIDRQLSRPQFAFFFDFVFHNSLARDFPLSRVWSNTVSLIHTPLGFRSSVLQL
jgi:hypothetical protein